MEWQAALRAAQQEYAERHAGSREAMARMAAWMPGGDTRSTTWFAPFPLVMDRADGVEMIDVDGNVLLDFLGNYTALVHGHRPPFILDAILAALERDVLFGAPMPEQGELARRIVGRLGSAERVRFTNSGTEAGMVAARIARRFTGRERLAIAEHSYHGSYEPLVWEAAERTGTTTFPVNDIDGATKALDAAGPLAAVYLEPVLGSGGVITAEDDFLAFLRQYATASGALLVFDEVMTFRLGYGGRQEATGVTPDLTMLGKIIGGGMPVAAVAGRADVLGLAGRESGAVRFSGGTYSAHPASMLAAKVMLTYLAAHEAEIYPRLAELGQQTRAALEAAFAEEGITMRCSGAGHEVVPGSSMFRLHFPHRPDQPLIYPEDIADSALCDVTLAGRPLQLALLLENVHLMQGRGALSTAHTPADVAFFAEASRRAAHRLSA